VARSSSPPNRACGFPAHGSPVSGFTSQRTGRPWPRQDSGFLPKLGKGVDLSFHLREIASMKDGTTSTKGRVVRTRRIPPGSAASGTRGVNRTWCSIVSSTFLHPFARLALPSFNARMGALTSERPALRPSEHEHRPDCRSDLPASRVWPL
jgi:hypothetical protein